MIDQTAEPGAGLHADRAADRRRDHRHHRGAADPELPRRAAEGEAEADRGRHAQHRHRDVLLADRPGRRRRRRRRPRRRSTSATTAARHDPPTSPTVLVPQYMQAVPVLDGWKNPYRLLPQDRQPAGPAGHGDPQLRPRRQSLAGHLHGHRLRPHRLRPGHRLGRRLLRPLAAEDQLIARSHAGCSRALA